MAIRFNGTIQNLKEMLKNTRGAWTSKRSGQYVFRTSEGGVLNWWPSTGTIQIQGTKNGRIFLENILHCYTNSPPSRIRDKSGLDNLELIIKYRDNRDAATQLQDKLQLLGIENIFITRVGSDTYRQPTKHREDTADSIPFQITSGTSL